MDVMEACIAFVVHCKVVLVHYVEQRKRCLIINLFIYLPSLEALVYLLYLCTFAKSMVGMLVGLPTVGELRQDALLLHVQCMR